MSLGDCIDAFAETARLCGLKCPECLSGVRSEVASGACGSLTVARMILEETVPDNAEQVFDQLVGYVEKYQQDKKQRHCRGLNLAPTALDCNGMGPLVMDLLIQLLLESERNDG